MADHHGGVPGVDDDVVRRPVMRRPSTSLRARVPTFRSSVEPVLGTRLTMRIDCDEPSIAALAERAALDTADRLEAVLSVYRPGSPFVRWRQGSLTQPPAELIEVLGLAAAWHARSNGAFNPSLGSVIRRWRRAEQEQACPERAELRRLAEAAAELPFAVIDGEVIVRGDCGLVDVHGIAKGWVIDRMVEAAATVDGVLAVLVDLGGDMRHAATNPESFAGVAIENPFVVADNADSLEVIRLRNQAVATSAGGRRGWLIGGRWYGHLLDPTTGWPLEHGRSSSVVADTAADADAAASAFAVLRGQAAEALASSHRLAVLTVGDDGRVWRGESWPGGWQSSESQPGESQPSARGSDSANRDPEEDERHGAERAGGEERAAPPLALEDLDADPGEGDQQQQDC